VRACKRAPGRGAVMGQFLFVIYVVWLLVAGIEEGRNGKR
jgi:hypothetical protein